MRGAIVACVLLLACGKTSAFGPPGGHVPDARGPCGLVTCATAGATCGPLGDGCGDVVECGDCSAPDTCGGDGVLFACGSGSGGCRPRTCGDAGAACGRVADGCGGLSDDCGTCGSGESCGAAGVANQCGVAPCSGLCTQQQACAGMPRTSISGRVTAPGHDDVATFGAPDPIFGALVYVPNGAAGPPTWGVQPFTAGVSCDTCSSLVSGAPLVQATTAVDGSFTIDDAPCGTNIPLVIQLGRWRRQITIPSVACCANTALTGAQTHLPRTHGGAPGDVRSDIPKIAVVTGEADTLHCVLRKMGVADSEFGNPNGTGRVAFYQDNGASIDASTPKASSTIEANPNELAKYDATLFECTGTQDPKSPTQQQRVIDYANAGGRVFATHFSYVWLTDQTETTGNTGPRPFSQTAAWNVDQSQTLSESGLVDETLQGDPATQARRVAFGEWLQLTGASPTAGQIPVDVVRQDFDSVSTTPGTAAGTPAQRWLYSASQPLTYTFDTPIAYAPSPEPTTQCGRVMFSDFHVTDTDAPGTPFPEECTDGPMTPQERTLEFMLFDLSSCTGPQPSACERKTCADFGLSCGLSGDGCDDGVVLNCGGCENGRTCGGGGYGQCGTGLCVPQKCADIDAECGTVGDGCGGTESCGTCPNGADCGGGGSANHCGPILK